LTEKSTGAQVIKKRVLRITLRIISALLIILLTGMGVISLPYVQTRLTNRLSAWLFDRIGHEVTVGYINIRWFDTIFLRDVAIRDFTGTSMITADRIILDFKLQELLTRNIINFDHAMVTGADMDMIRNAPDGDFNFTYFLDRIREEYPGSGENPKIFTIDKLQFYNSSFMLFRPEKDFLRGQFDYHHFTLQEIQAELDNFTIKPGHISFALNNLQCTDSASGLQITQANTRFILGQQSMVFQDMQLAIGKSSLHYSMVFSFSQPSAMREFVDSVHITANIKQSLMHTDDLSMFIPALGNHRQYYRLRGFAEGPVKGFDAKNITLELGNSSRIEGYISVYGFPNLEETFINAKVNSGTLHMRDMGPYTNQQNYEALQKFGTVRFDGRFSGFYFDFVSNARFETGLGNISTDINLKIDEVTRQPSYSGRLLTRDFNLGLLLSDTATYQMLELEGSIRGSGLSREKAQFDLKAEIGQLGYRQYVYHNITTDATFANQFFKGNLTIRDPNLQFVADAQVDLSPDAETIRVNARLDTADLQELRLTDDHAFVNANLDIDIRGLRLDDMLGSISLNDLYVEYLDRSLFIDTLKILSEKDTLSRSLILSGSHLTLRLFGNFNYSSFFADAARAFQEYKMVFANDSSQIRNYYAVKKSGYSDYYFLDYEARLSDVNPLVQLFEPDIYIAENTLVTGSFTGGPASIIELNSQPSRVDLGKLSFRDNHISVNSTKLADTTLIFADYLLKSGRQYYDKQPKTEGLELNIDWKEHLLDFRLSADQYRAQSYARLHGTLEFRPGETHIRMDTSDLQLIRRNWHFTSSNRIVLRKHQIRFDDFTLYSDDQRISANGLIDQDPDPSLFLTLENFGMENLNTFIGKELHGVANGSVRIRNFFDEREVGGELILNGLKVNEFPVGDILASTEYQNAAKRFRIDMELKHEGTETINAGGYFIPSHPTNQLDVRVNFNHSNLSFLEPFIEDYVAALGGYLDGEVAITGMLRDPNIDGYGNIGEGRLLFKYLNTRYTFHGSLQFRRNEINLSELVLNDTYGNPGTMRGRFSHRGFRDLGFDVSGRMENFLVLNTTARDNPLYYGTAYATGDLRIFGQRKNINIRASARSEKGTRFFIPLEGGEEVVQEDFIRFVGGDQRPSEPGDEEEEDQGVQLEGIRLDFDLDITPDAYCEIIFDLTAGDIIRGRGNGDLKLQIDTNGEFLMFGDFEILEGGYNFTLYNIINKEFDVSSGSRISWMGDPYGAILDIQATYRQMASLLPILRVGSDQENYGPEITRRYPALVMLNINGDLRYPEIDFDISIEDYPKSAVVNGISLETQVTAFRNKLETDEQELNRQVFSLIILKNFSSENAFNMGGSVQNSMSEFISNQVSYWISQFDENLEIDVDLGALDEAAFNTFQLRMSYSFLEGRLRVTRDGGFTNQSNEANVASILGDWSVEYLLTDDGKYRVKVYNRTNFNNLNPSVRSTATTAGFSMLHTASFDQLRELFSRTRERARAVPEDPDAGPSGSEVSDSTLSLIREP
jgi:hypothetical protein